MTLLIILLTLFLLTITTCSNRNIRNFADTTEAINCSNYRGPSRPYIFPLLVANADYARDSDTRSSSVFVIKNEQSGSNIQLSRQFNCTYTKPIQWVFHWDPNDKELGIELDFSERLVATSVGRDKDEEPEFTYTSNFQLRYFRRDIQDMLFACQPVQITNPCERSFIQVQNGLFDEFPVSVPNKALITLSNALLKSTNKDKAAIAYQEKLSCPLRLFLKVHMGNGISYRWETSNGQTKGIENTTRTTNETTYLTSIFHLNETHEPNCIQILNDTEPCHQCGEVRGKNYTTNAVILHATYKNVTLVYKGYFSVPKNERWQRKFFFDWRLSETLIQKHMMKLLVPENVYAGVPFQVRCRVSIFFFSYGTTITENDSLNFDSAANTREYFKNEGYREITRTMMFEESKQPRIVSCFSPLKTSPHPLVKSVPILVQTPIAPIIDNTPGTQNITVFRTISDGTEFVVAECSVSGNPSPTLNWIFPSKIPPSVIKNLNVTRGKGFIGIRFPKWESAFAGTYICEATNFLGVAMKVMTFQHKSEEADTKIAVIISSSLGAFVLLLGISIGFLAWKIRKQRLEFEIQTQEAIDEFRNGINSEKMPELDIQDPNFSILQMPYNEAFEVPEDKWTIEDKILGTGQFGIVRMGSLVLKGGTVKVAVKSLKSSVEIDEFKSFLFELKIMAYLGQHRNIVSLIAACTEGIDNRDIFIGVEFCDNGCLLEYLRKYRASFLNMVDPNGRISDLPTVLHLTPDYANVSTFSTHQLYRWAYHIACGMDYLRIRKVLHGDLAARNVLLTTRNVAKVGDFGLSRVLMNSENYTKKSKTALPWKWMAIESLTEKVFSVESDVWAYGVCLYEIFTLGQSPYPGISWSPDFVTQLQNGMRMEKPLYCTTSIYKVMRATWETDPHQRPNYANIKRKLSKGLQRLSAIIDATKEQEQTRPPSSTDSTSSRLQNSTSLSPVVIPAISLPVQEDAGIYTNVPRRSMNYYKNS